MNAGGGDLTGGEQSGQVGFSLEIGAHASHGVVGSRSDGNHIRRDIDVVFHAGVVDAREARLDALGAEVCEIKVDDRIARRDDLHLMDNGARHHVTRRQLGHLVILGHEAQHLHIAQLGSLAAQGLRDEEARSISYVQSGGMKLDKLHVADFCSGAKGHGDAVAGRDRWVCGFAVDLTDATRRQQNSGGAGVVSST